MFTAKIAATFMIPHEELEIVDEQNQPLGSTKDRVLVHRDGDWHRTVHVWIINSQQQLLIQKRGPKLTSHPNKWDISAAGHIIAEENSIMTAIKELNEELGIELEPENFEYLGAVKQQSIQNNGTYINNEFNDVYLVQLDRNLRDFAVNSDEVSELRFIDFRELEQLANAGQPDLVPHDDEYRMLFEELHKRYG